MKTKKVKKHSFDKRGHSTSCYCRVETNLQHCIREDGVVYVMEKLCCDGKWVVTTLMSTVKEIIEDQLLLYNNVKLYRVAKYVRADDTNVKLAG